MAIVTCVTHAHVQGAAAAAAKEPLRVWLVFNLPPRGSDVPPAAVDDFIRTWHNAGLDLRSLRDEALAMDKADFRRQLFGQEVVLRHLAAFRRARPGFPVIELSFFGWDNYWQMLRSTPLAKRPDLAQIPSSWCSSLAGDLGVLAPLTDAEARQVATDVEARFLEPCRVDGNGATYGVPWLLDVRLLFFWRDDLPGLDENLKTFPTARAAFKASLQASPRPPSFARFGLPTARDWELLHQFSLLVWGQGGDLVAHPDVLGYRWGEAVFRQPGLQAAEFLLDLAKNNLMVLPRETRQTLERQFVDHQLGSLVSGPWLLDQLPKASLPAIGVVVPPFYGKAPITFFGGSLLGMTNRAPELREPAWQLAHHLAAGEAALPWALDAGLIPASTQARGSAAAALDRSGTLDPASCAVYFDCVLARTGLREYVDALDRALGASRTLPALSNWWQLEYPAHLGSLYHFWQELAAQQPRESLDLSLQMMTHEWNEVLMRPRRTALNTLVVIAVVLAVIVAAVLFRRHVNARAARQVAEANRRKQEAVERAQMILDVIRHLVPPQHVERVENAVRTIVQPRRRFVITLPTTTSEKLALTRDGRVVDDIESPAAKMIEYMARHSLLHRQRPIHFSIVTAEMWLWTVPKATLADGQGRLQSIVAGMRHAFGKGLKVIGKGRHTVYEWQLPDSEYQCLVPAVTQDPPPAPMDFAVAVGEPFVEASRLQDSDPAAAFTQAVRAFDAETHLLRMDVEVALLVCELRGKLGETAVEPHLEEAVARARAELGKAAVMYRSFFATHASLDAFLRAYKITTEEIELTTHWTTFHETWKRIGLITNDEALPGLPEEIAKAWDEARLTLEARDDDDRESRDESDALGRVVTYVMETTAVPIVSATTHTLTSLKLDEKTVGRFEGWTKERLLERAWTLVLEGLRENVFPDHRQTIVDLHASLCQRFKETLQPNAADAFLLKLLTDSRPHRDTLRAELRAEALWPSDFPSYLVHVHERARSQPMTRGTGHL